MKKRIFIIHGWSGSPEKDWLPWAISELQNKNYKVIAPLMPDTDVPKIDPWVNKLQQIVGTVRPDDIFIGHSIGCQTILRFLEKLDTGKVDKVILIAPWMKLTNLSAEEHKIAESWVQVPIVFENIKSKSASFIAIFSDDDAWVPLKVNQPIFQEKLGVKTIVLHNKGHFTNEENVTEIPEILELL